MRHSPHSIERGLAHLRNADPIMRDLIALVGPFQLGLEGNRFRALVRSIVAQQISGHAAQSIFSRLVGLLHPADLTADALAALSIQQLRTAGLSSQKASYLNDLAQKVRDRHVRLNVLGRFSDEAVIEELIQIRGIGVWTAQMFLIFSLGRLDVFPHADLGIRVALKNLYGLKTLPDQKTGQSIAQCWKPYATLASWYCWRSLDLKKSSDKPPFKSPKTKPAVSAQQKRAT